MYCAPQKSVFCGASNSTIACLDLQQKLKPFLHSSQEQMEMRIVLEFIALFCSSEVLFVKFPWFLFFQFWKTAKWNLAFNGLYWPNQFYV